MLRDISQNAPDLLLEAGDRLLQSLQSCKAITCDYDVLSASGANTRLGVLKFGDEFFRLVSAMGARYRQRGFVIPSSFDEGHD